MAGNYKGKGKSKDSSDGPVHKVRIGYVEATVWRNEGDNGTWYNITCRRSWKDDKDEWQNSDSFGLRESCQLIQALQMATAWAAEAEQADREAERENGSKSSR